MYVQHYVWYYILGYQDKEAGPQRAHRRGNHPHLQHLESQVDVLKFSFIVIRRTQY